jgi:hypothetical protein
MDMVETGLANCGSSVANGHALQGSENRSFSAEECWTEIDLGNGTSGDPGNEQSIYSGDVKSNNQRNVEHIDHGNNEGYDTIATLDSMDRGKERVVTLETVDSGFYENAESADLGGNVELQDRDTVGQPFDLGNVDAIRFESAEDVDSEHVDTGGDGGEGVKPVENVATQGESFTDGSENYGQWGGAQMTDDDGQKSVIITRL